MVSCGVAMIYSMFRSVPSPRSFYLPDMGTQHIRRRMQSLRNRKVTMVRQPARRARLQTAWL